jgi:co-chaperonin GroES (HSP10)
MEINNMYNDYYLLKRFEEEKAEGLDFAKALDDFSFKGEIIRTPSGSEFQKGDKIMFLKDTGDDVVIQDETFKIIKGTNIIMKL